MEHSPGRAARRKRRSQPAAVRAATPLGEAPRDQPGGVAIGARRRARELALGVLFRLETTQTEITDLPAELDSTLALMASQWEMPSSELRKLRREIVGFALRLVQTFRQHQEEIDRRIAELAEGWALDRMPTVDRNVLRIALTEVLYFGDVPTAASIDEAVDIAKTYSTEDSGKFVNGILGTLARTTVSA